MVNSAIVLFNFIGIFGLVLLVVVFLTAMGSSKVVRSPTWFSYIAAGIVISLTNLLIMGQQTGQAPVRWACFMQAILIYPNDTLATWSSCTLLAQTYFSMRCIEQSRRMPTTHALLFTIIPSIITVCVLAGSAALAAIHPDIVQRDPSGMRCHFNERLDTMYHATIGTALCGVILILIFETLLIRKMYQKRRALKGGLQTDQFPNSIIIRATFFNLFLFVSVIISTCTVTGSMASFAANNMEMVFIPVAAGILFGSQKDIMGIWISWIPERYNIFNNQFVPDH